MLNLKSDNFSLRGKIGELIAKSQIPFSSRTGELSVRYLYKKFSFGFISSKQREFLIKNGRSFDLFRLIISEEGDNLKGIEIYEVKTKKR